VILRMPPAWRPAAAASQGDATIGRREPSALGLGDCSISGRGDARRRNADGAKSTLCSPERTDCAPARQWVEVDRARLEQAMTRFRDAESWPLTRGEFREAMRMIAALR